MLLRLYLLILLCGACSGSDGEDRRLQLSFHTPSGCPVTGALSQLSLEARGNFPPSGALVVPFGQPFAPSTIDRFPPSTSQLVASAAGVAYEAQGAASIDLLPSGASVALVLAPLDDTCQLLGDFEFRSLPFDVVAVTRDESVLLAGGLPGTEEGSRRLLRLPSDLSLSQVLEPLSVARIGATATRSEDRIVIAGGAIFDDERALDTFVVLDSTGAVVFADRTLCPADDESCDGRRRDHGAVVVADGRVLLFGGVRRAGASRLADEILNSAVLINPRDGSVDTEIDLRVSADEQIRSRRLPSLLTLDTGETFVVGGQGEGGGFTGTAYRFELFEKRFTPMLLEQRGGAEPTTRVLPFQAGVHVALAGGRFAFFTGEASVPVIMVTQGSTLVQRVDVSLDLPDGPLSAPRAVALPDGTVYLTGTSAVGIRSYHVDLGTAMVRSVPPPAAETERLIALNQGAVLELSDIGVSYRRLLLRTPFDNPPARLLPTDGEWLAYDAAPGWTVSAQGASPNRSGRISLAGLSLEAFELVVDSDAGTQVVLQPMRSGAPQVSLRLDGATVSIGLCEIGWDGAPLRISRIGEQVTLITEAGERVCRVPGFSGAVGVNFNLEAGSEFRSLQVERL